MHSAFPPPPSRSFERLSIGSLFLDLEGARFAQTTALPNVGAPAWLASVEGIEVWVESR